MLQPDQDNQKNLLLAIVLSVAVLLAWQFLYAGPKLKEEQERQARIRQEQVKAQEQAQPGTPKAGAPDAVPGKPGVATAPAASVPQDRGAALGASPRVAIDTPSVKGSISLKGGRIDDVVLAKYRETVDPKSPNVVLFSPSGSPHPYYAEYGWIAGPGVTQPMPNADTLWKAEKAGPLTPSSPVTLIWDNGQGLDLPPHHLGRRQLPVHRLRRGGEQDRQRRLALPLRADLAARPAQGRRLLHPARGLHRRDGRRRPAGDRLRRRAQGGRREDLQADRRLARLHRQVLGRGADPRPDGALSRRASPASRARYPPRTPSRPTSRPGPSTIAPGAKQTFTSHLFAGAKVVNLIDTYDDAASAPRFDLMVDWGYFWFLTKPLYKLLHWLGLFFGNYGLAILGRHGARQARVLPARQQELRVDGQDEDAAAGDGEAARALQGRPRQACSRS